MTVNVTERDLALMDALVLRHAPFACRHAIHVVALRVGLEQLVQDESLVKRVVGDLRVPGVYPGPVPPGVASESPTPARENL